MLQDYYKISDTLFKFKDNTELKFNSILSYFDSYNNVRYFHSEYSFYKSDRNGEQIQTSMVKRYPNYYLSIENKNNNSFIKMRDGDFYQFKTTLNTILQMENHTRSLQIESNQFITFDKKPNSLMIDFNGFKVLLDSFELINFVAIINDINLINLWNCHTQYISSSNYLGMEFLNFKITDNTDKSTVTTKSNYKTEKYKGKKKSFFD